MGAIVMINLSIDQVDELQASLSQIRAVGDLLFATFGAENVQAISRNSIQNSTVIIDDLTRKIELMIGGAVLDSQGGKHD